MNCAEAERFFDAHLDGELAGSLRLEFDAHRLHCRTCQQKLAMMEACEHILAGGSDGPKLSLDFTNRVMAEIHQKKFEADNLRKRRLVLMSAVGLQVAAVIMFAFLWVGHWSKSSAPELRPGDDPTFTSQVGQAIEERDRVRLMALVSDKTEEFLAAKSNLASDVNALASYAPSLWNIFVPPAGTGGPPGLLDFFDGLVSPQSVEEEEPQPDASGVYSL